MMKLEVNWCNSPTQRITFLGRNGRSAALPLPLLTTLFPTSSSFEFSFCNEKVRFILHFFLFSPQKQVLRLIILPLLWIVVILRPNLHIFSLERVVFQRFHTRCWLLMSPFFLQSVSSLNVSANDFLSFLYHLWSFSEMARNSVQRYMLILAKH